MENIDINTGENGALPPKSTIIRKALPPKSTILKSIEKSYSIWALLFLFLAELVSYMFWDHPKYDLSIYAILNNLGFSLLLLNVWTWRKRLNFCKFKSFGILALIGYYVWGIFAVVMKLESFLNFVPIFLLFLSCATIFKIWKI